MHYVFLLGCALLFITSPARAGDETELQLQNRLQAHIEFLADDVMRGRQTGSRGYITAANYVASQFRQMGLLPAGNEGSYFQQVPLRRALQESGSAEMILKQAGETTKLVFVEEFYMGPSLGRATTELEAGLVFAGYGIEAAELGHNDFANLDVKGKVVVTFAGQPHGFPSEEGAHFASRTERAKAAVRHGAIGLLSIHTPRSAKRYQWDRLRSRVGSPSMGWINGAGKVHGVFDQIQAGGMIRHTAADPLFRNAPVDLPTLLEFDESGQPLPGFALEGAVEMRQRSSHENISSPNVVAVLPGSDPLLANEYVLYIAHLDHIGELHADGLEEGQADPINNGALDNASGVSVMLETARLLTQGQPPRRSVLFIAVTAEEKGLVGSEYFAMNPTVPIASIVSAVNLDMPLLLFDFADVIAFGAQHSELGDAVRAAARDFAIELTPDPFPEQNIFVRSDHYRLVQQGIPSVYLVTGVKSRDEDVDTGLITSGFLQKHYHKPSDDLNLPIHYGAAARFTRINARIGELIANEPDRPDWHEGDFFGRTFAR
ncbi:MAG: M28 family peptidase [Xanthomonadales bacterium]|nr:M28 family peptidase [Gammaproteobacteria bacterium]MBT8072291.1 M28 family peptidase [Gammaproteobacteria bacterium]NNK03130.1 M28 family peptidase [Xanthomonadales bacterium]